jgi:hypothetical protein
MDEDVMIESPVESGCVKDYDECDDVEEEKEYVSIFTYKNMFGTEYIETVFYYVGRIKDSSCIREIYDCEAQSHTETYMLPYEIKEIFI